jgi:hypothetical protein
MPDIFTEDGAKKAAYKYGSNPQSDAGEVPDMEDLPKEKVERKDGLPTKDDLKEMMGGKCGHPTMMKSVSVEIGDDKKQSLVSFLQGILGLLD